MDFEEEFGEELEQVPPEFFDRDRFVPAIGSLEADVALVGEAPGADEVEQGEPFVGRAGEVLNQVLEDIGVAREELYITNLVKIRPPNNRDPKREEIEAWDPVLEAELDCLNPETVVSLGNFASRELIGTEKGISQLHGKVFNRKWRILPVFHPAATLYDPDKRPVLEKDLRKAFGKPEEGQKTLKDL
ncbi:MAG: uracil-DNA glycosylase [Candidatus Nanohaloarchaeota archaeon QJJ-7]|nr:uracil-DNA glycosylase [Candidatus Nanohaloarchaeota archaeon QJJ-7]